MAIDRTSTVAFARLEDKANRVAATAFLEAQIEITPYKIRIVLTDNGVQFCCQPSRRNGPAARYFRHMFDMRGQENGIEYGLTKPHHPWTNGLVERMNGTLKDAMVKRYHYEMHEPAKGQSPTLPGRLQQRQAPQDDQSLTP